MPRAKPLKTQTGGNCYQNAANLLLERTDCTLVHGYPRLTSDDEHRGKLFGHAWLECEIDGIPWVIDGVHGFEKPIFKSLYYHIGQIEESLCTRYTFAEACKLMLQHEHYGPWQEEPVGAL